MQENSLLACSCFGCQQQWQNLLLTNFWVNNFITNVDYRDTNARCRDNAGRW